MILKRPWEKENHSDFEITQISLSKPGPFTWEWGIVDQNTFRITHKTVNPGDFCGSCTHE